MSTLKQIEANRLNAAKSTGPRTAEGKSAVRLNALKHGIFAADPIIPGEDPAHLEALHASHYESFQPATAEEHVLVAALIRDAWRLERCSNSETAVWAHSFEWHKQEKHRFARSEIYCSKDLMHLQRRIDAAERNYRRNLELLIKLQAARVRTRALASEASRPAAVQAPDAKPEPIPQSQSTQPLNPENGSVPANPIPAAPTPEPARHRVTFPILGRSGRPEPPPEAA
jgi:hypothetical protein